MLISLWEVCQERVGQEGGDLEDIQGSWRETWRTGSSLMSWMMFFYPKEYILKKLCWYVCGKYVRKGGSKREVFWECWGFQTKDIVERVIHDVIDVLGRPKQSYPENVVSLSSFFGWNKRVCYHGNRNITTRRHTDKHWRHLYKICFLASAKPQI